MKLLLPAFIVERLTQALRRGKTSEIGGVLVGEHVAGDVFRIVDLSVQLSGGTAAHFIRDHKLAKLFLDDFFERTGRAYDRYNYIGEWHSHPLFAPLPSGEDFVTMHQLVADPEVGVNFAVLIIARLSWRSRIDFSATLFRQGNSVETVEVEIDGNVAEEKITIWTCLRRLLFLR